MKKVPVNKIIPSSFVDGPGNRTSIFLQACNLACAYCHNPETQRMCIHCGICVEHCPADALYISEEGKVIWKEEVCTQCDSCIKVCPHYASPKIKWMNAYEVYAEVKRNLPFIRGITVSGGECLLYPEFLEELFTLAQTDKLTCLIDHNGTIDISNYPGLLEVTDGIMLDIKSWDLDNFKRLTSGENHIVKKNLKYLEDINKLEEIRIVCLEDEVDAEEIIKQIPETLGKTNIRTKLKLIKFRRYGVKGRLADTDSPSDEYMENLKDLAIENGFKNVVIL